jgi:acetyl/propionyl-CoA carboxylase alpha subunit
VDSGIGRGTIVSPHYDAILAKVITWGQDRDDALRKMARALRDTVILGVKSNLPLLLDILEEPAFRSGRTSTAFLQRDMAAWSPARDAEEADFLAAAAWELLGGNGRLPPERAGSGRKAGSDRDPWDLAAGWRNVS